MRALVVFLFTFFSFTVQAGPRSVDRNADGPEYFSFDDWKPPTQLSFLLQMARNIEAAVSTRLAVEVVKPAVHAAIYNRPDFDPKSAAQGRDTLATLGEGPVVPESPAVTAILTHLSPGFELHLWDIGRHHRPFRSFGGMEIAPIERRAPRERKASMGSPVYPWLARRYDSGKLGFWHFMSKPSAVARAAVIEGLARDIPQTGVHELLALRPQELAKLARERGPLIQVFIERLNTVPQELKQALVAALCAGTLAPPPSDEPLDF